MMNLKTRRGFTRDAAYGAGLLAAAAKLGGAPFAGASDAPARPTLSTAAGLGVSYFKLGYWHYPAGLSIEQRLEEVRRDVAGLVALGKEYGISAGFHNHSGNYVGAAIWDIRAIIADMD